MEILIGIKGMMPFDIILSDFAFIVRSEQYYYHSDTL